MQKLKSKNVPFVSEASFTALERAMSALVTDLEAGLEKAHDACTKLETKAKEEHNQREIAEGSIKTMFEGKLEELENGKINAILKQLTVVKDYFDHLPVLFTHVGQMQWLLEHMNQNLPKGGLMKWEWSHNFKKQYAVLSPFPEDNVKMALPEK
ncbi:hypothetical protein SVAN01_03893 [Stagonosporopsis vannaccii]|nr:hypothetical protein SVAN01_03893 [Stagonosporopsis vannaccii]